MISDELMLTRFSKRRTWSKSENFALLAVAIRSISHSFMSDWVGSLCSTRILSISGIDLKVSTFSLSVNRDGVDGQEIIPTVKETDLNEDFISCIS